jgi:ParB-like chromosome segregation protein Spo0J
MSELRLEYIPVNELVPYDKNPRKNDAAAEKVAELIKEYGFKKPILVDVKNNKNEIIAGHTRLKAALLLGLEKVPVIFADDLSPEQVKAFRIADNKSGEWAEWDNELLIPELTDLRESGFDISLTGFSEMSLDGFDTGSEPSGFDVDSFLTDEEKPDKKPKLITCPRCGESFAQYEVL